VRVETGKDIGSLVKIKLEPDATPREVQVPDDLAKLLAKNKAAKTFFDALSFTNRKEYVNWITGAKKEETRLARLTKALELLRAGKRGNWDR
jgi:uncharacterized protein YdeI (YjbR/CyaY-like superfamily)